MSRQILVTNALPYANGPLHLGHMVGYVQADIWVRFQRMCGHGVTYVCADDAHGTPIMLAAEKAGVTPEQFIAGVQVEHARDFHDFGVHFDNYHSTHTEENRYFSELIYSRLKEGGSIARRSIQQLYDPVKEMFLPDRYIKGECPKCGTADQYGDNCENCGAAYSPTDLKNPRSVVSGAPPVMRDSEHFFFELSKFQTFLQQWLEGSVAHSSVKAKLREWFDAGLKDWDISRDAPYFGFAIPSEPGKFFYVWLDAPIGYMASHKALCKKTGQDFDAYWNAGSSAELHHFIGKDIVNFHGLFWPAMLYGSQHRTPTKLHVNGYLTINGAKMSKSRGTFVRARTWLDNLDPEYLRYYFAAKLGSGVDDLDLDMKDFQARVNSDLVGKFVNIASRCAGFIEKQFGGRLAAQMHDRVLFDDIASEADSIHAMYEAGEFSAALREIMLMADDANAEIQKIAPWTLAKDPEKREHLHQVCTTFLNVFRQISLYLKPVLPNIAAKVERFLDVTPLEWAHVGVPLLDHPIRSYEALIVRVEPKAVDAMMAAEAGEIVAAAPAAPAKKPAAPAAEAAKPAAAAGDGAISIDDFGKVDLRIARIASAEHIEGAEKLLRLKLDLGPLGERQVFAGIKAAYKPEDLVGRLTMCVANLAPRKMKFGMSEGMVLAASDDRGGPFLLAPDAGAQPGMRVK
ncbi:methionyl-tRNA synthetase [Panacagrimonas perspica]|uniref:Methionine--tRNA ligase n=1 Tax=Panacagrimonas perspica TaxID=381431 RepID=A0A4R7PDR9_9GAMM|nr:methionine--tRNA ligase [Panacagrimonas perspica]TDU32334.1 methionyl-tRNA synthetase [Panacagrimonas perspica]THD05271.1 methionine--tRNA ligase [Panacagrimonas perspica]